MRTFLEGVKRQGTIEAITKELVTRRRIFDVCGDFELSTAITRRVLVAGARYGITPRQEIPIFPMECGGAPTRAAAASQK
jgi:hypothetical protein